MPERATLARTNLKRHRNAQLIAHYQDNGSLRATAAAFGLSHQRVKEIIEEHGLTTHSRAYRIDDRDADAEVEAAARAIHAVMDPGAPWKLALKRTHELYRRAARAALGREGT